MLNSTKILEAKRKVLYNEVQMVVRKLRVWDFQW